MEDAHIAVLNLGNKADTAMFGVFDGHGGRYLLQSLPCHRSIESRQHMPRQYGAKQRTGMPP